MLVSLQLPLHSSKSLLLSLFKLEAYALKMMPDLDVYTSLDTGCSRQVLEYFI